MFFKIKLLHKLFKCINNRDYFMDFSKIRALYKVESKLSCNSYINNIELHLSHNSKLFLNYIENL